MVNDIEYILIASLVAITALTLGGIGYGAKCRTAAAAAEGEKLALAFSILRDGPVSTAVEELLIYLDQERRLEPQLFIADLLAHSPATEQLKVLERVGEQRSELRQLSREIKRFANLSRYMFVIPLFGFPAILLPLGLHLDFASAVWYIAWGAVTSVLVLAGLVSVHLMHDRRVKFEELLSNLKVDVE